MGYYCTVPQCTSLAGKSKNVKFHRFPRDGALADRWNEVLRRGKPYTKYSKVCSKHFTQADYLISAMGQWKTLNKDAMPSQNLPRLNPDGSLMVLRKNRSPKHRPDDANTSYGSNSSEESGDPSSLVSLAKEYLAATAGRESWYDGEPEDDEEQDDQETNDKVLIKQEYPCKRTVQMQDATIQTDLCQPSLGLRRNHESSGFFPQHMVEEGGSLNNYFQTSTTEQLSLPKEPLGIPSLHKDPLSSLNGGVLSSGTVRPDFRRIFLDQLDQTRKKRPTTED